METYNSTVMPLPLNTVICGYRLKSVIAQGGFGITYLGVQESTGQEVVIKESLPEHCVTRQAGEYAVRVRAGKEGTGKGSYQWATDAFINEAQTLWSLSHPCIVKVLEAFNSDDTGTAYYVMPYLPGNSLEYYINNNARPSREWLLYIMASLLDALVYLHGTGRLHRDIKPANILLEADGRPVMIDFGAARSVSKSDKTCVYTPSYSPVEQQRGTGEGPHTDIYSLGATLYHWVSGMQVPGYESRVGSHNSYRPLSTNPDLVAVYGENVLATIDKAVAAEPEDRFATAQEWRALLVNEPGFQMAVPVPPPGIGGVAAVVPPTPTVIGSKPIPLKSSGKTIALVCVLVFLFLVLLGVSGFAYWRHFLANDPASQLADTTTEQTADTGTTPASTATTSISDSGTRAPSITQPKANVSETSPGRILARPDSFLYEDGETDSTIGEQLPLYAIFYIKGQNGKRYQVSEMPNGEPVGWMNKEDVHHWNNNLALHFTHPGGILKREPALFFDSWQHSQDYYRKPENERCTILDRVASKADVNDLVEGLLAKEPDRWSPDCHQSLLPVLNFQLKAAQEGDERSSNQEELYLQTVALNHAGANREPDKPSIIIDPGKKRTVKVMPDVDIVFVMDTTKSMGPYIKKLREYLNGQAETIDRRTEKRARFGFVGYRDFAIQNGKVNETYCGYTAKVFTPDELLGAEDFAKVITKENVDETEIDSIDYAEDVLAGVHKAIKEIPWRKGSMRFVFVIGDARGRSGNTVHGEVEDRALCNNAATWRNKGRGSLCGMTPEQLSGMVAPDGGHIYVRPMYQLCPPAHIYEKGDKEHAIPLYTPKEWQQKVMFDKESWDRHIYAGVKFFDRLASASLENDSVERKDGNYTIFTLDNIIPQGSKLVEYTCGPADREGKHIYVQKFDDCLAVDLGESVELTENPDKIIINNNNGQKNSYSAMQSLFSAAYLEWMGNQPLPEADEQGRSVEIYGWTSAQDPSARDIVNGCVILSRKQLESLVISLSDIIRSLEEQDEEGVAQCIDSLFNLMVVTTTDPNLDPAVKMPEPTLKSYMKNLPWLTSLMNAYTATVNNGDEIDANFTRNIMMDLNSKCEFLRNLGENGMWIKDNVDSEKDLIAIPLDQLP